MYCNPIDIPDTIIAAQEAGELVVFAGAGISYGGNADLPLFGGLAEKIGGLIGKGIPNIPNGSGQKRSDYDAILGEWSEAGAQVHQITHKIVSAPESQPNDAHTLILRLFQKPQHIRVVTTNYDRHFTTAAAELRLEIPIYKAPALPLGNDFNGIVYLHGSVDDKPERFVLTDADFGCAYLTRGWARAFLQDLYSRYCVLFVGYSHADTLLSYLARGLIRQDTKKRFALQPRGDVTRWKQLGIEVIPYDLIDESHENLTRGLRRWVELADLRPQDTRARIHQIIDEVEKRAVAINTEQSTPNKIELPQDADDFLTRRLKLTEGAKWFREKASDLNWVMWLHTRELLKSFATDEPPNSHESPDNVLIRWTVHRLMEAETSEALRIFQKIGGRFGKTASFEVFHLLVNSSDDSLVWKSPNWEYWLVAVRQCMSHYDNSFFLTQLIQRLCATARTEQAVWMFAELLRVESHWTQSLPVTSEDNDVGLEAKLIGEKWQIEECWNALRKLNDSNVNEKLKALLIAAIENVYALSGPLNQIGDPIAGSRSIFSEPSSEHDPLDEVDYLPDMLMELLEELGESADGIGVSQIQRWLKSSCTGWRRIGYYALRKDTQIEASRKVQIILDYGLIFPKPLHWQLAYDPVILVSEVYSKIKNEEKKRLLDAIVAGPGALESYSKEWMVENEDAVRKSLRDEFLKNIYGRHKDDDMIKAALTATGIQVPLDERDPHDGNADDFEFKRKHFTDRSPKSVEELLREDPAKHIDEYLAFEGASVSWRGPNRTGLFHAIAAAANQDVHWGKQIIENLLRKRIYQGAIWNTLLWSLSIHSTDREFRKWFLTEALPDIDSAGWSLEDWNAWTYFLLRFDTKILTEFNKNEHQNLIAWSVVVWDAALRFPEKESSQINPRDLALNEPIGRVLEYWLNYTKIIRRTNPNAPYDWPDIIKDAIARLFESGIPKENFHMGLTVFGRWLAFALYAVPSWTKAMIFPRLDIGIHGDAAYALWKPWLRYGGISYELAEEIRPHFTRERRALLSLDDQTVDNFLTEVARMAFIKSIWDNMGILDWITEILADASPQRRGQWIEHVANFARHESDERKKKIWITWAKEYIEISGRNAICSEEYAGFVEWPLAFSSEADEALACVKLLPVRSVVRMRTLYNPPYKKFLIEDSNFAALYLRFILDIPDVERSAWFPVGEIIENAVISPARLTDWNAIADRLLTMGFLKEGDALVAKIRETNKPEA